MKVGIMQPYFFPYIGYFQYICAVDKFVFYNDVAFIKQGWINRNRILVNGEPSLFTVPVEQISSFRSIRDTKIHTLSFSRWKNTWLKTIEQNYKKAINFRDVFPLINAVINESTGTIGTLAEISVMKVLDYLNIPLPEFLQVESFQNDHLHAQERVLDICKQLNAEVYINPMGGTDLYSKEDFRKAGLELFFIQSKLTQYQQFNKAWTPSLSIIDVLMHNTSEEINGMLLNYELV
ncbi:WbqC family protein [Pollutibacter soli]|uniref:WbqC family protein n=1 Tax=Pollutibacter soli TaxID=3034157 RepID=UPI0030133D93